MARPKKSGLDYFSVDVDILQDIRIKKLIYRYGGGRALSVYLVLLTQIFKRGYFFEFDDDTSFLISIDLDEDETFVNQVIMSCINIGLFDKDTFEKFKVLTSVGIQKRYNSVMSSCKRNSVVDKYNLLNNSISKEEKVVSSEETKVISEETHINSAEKGVLNEETKVIKGKTSDNSEKTQVNSVESTQNKSKSKIINNIPSSSTSSARASDEEKTDSEWNYSLDEEIDLLRNDNVWKEETLNQLQLSGGNAELMRLLSDYRRERVCQGKGSHDSEADLKSHFMGWYRKVYGNSKNASEKKKPKQVSPPVFQLESPSNKPSREEELKERVLEYYDAVQKDGLKSNVHVLETARAWQKDGTFKKYGLSPLDVLYEDEIMKSKINL